MAREMKKVGLELTHIIGPKTGHSYEKEAKEEINRRIDAIVEKGREPDARRSSSSRPTRCATTSALGRRRRAWRSTGSRPRSTANVKDGRVDADDRERHRADASSLPAGPVRRRRDDRRPDGRRRHGERPNVDRRGSRSSFRKDGREVAAGDRPSADGLAKRHGLQGPIDDAFMDSFVDGEADRASR